jgi:hypothetical protein
MFPKGHFIMSNRIEYRNGCLIEHPQACDCTVCLDAWVAWMERQRALDRLALADIELRQAKPATAREWSEFFDREFPRSPA